jgi:hypothetical protein
MTDAFILGAGFAKAISPVMPLASDLGVRSVDQLKSVHRARVQPDQHAPQCDGLSCDGRTPLTAFSSGALNFEEWLTSLAEPQPYLLRPDNARREALFSELTGSVSWEIEQSVAHVVQGNDPPGWLAELVRRWHESRSYIVTFNYDTLIETTLRTLRIVNEARGGILTHTAIGPSVIPNWTAFYGGGSRLSAADSFRLWKLHGSTHWYWDDTTKAADSIVQIGLRHEWETLTPSFNDEEREHRAPGKVPMIVPPTTGKSVYFNNPVIRYLWHDAWMALNAARRIFIFGYSLPHGDILVRSMLADLMPGKEVWVIDLNPEVGERVAELKPGAVNCDFNGSGLNPEEFVTRLEEVRA